MGEGKNINKVALKKALVKGILPDMALPYVLVRPLLNGGRVLRPSVPGLRHPDADLFAHRLFGFFRREGKEAVILRLCGPAEHRPR